MFVIAKNENVNMTFTDEEESRCTLTNNAELAEAYNCCSYSYELVRTFFFKNKRIFNS
jgi:hypothetical protein